MKWLVTTFVSVMILLSVSISVTAGELKPHEVIGYKVTAENGCTISYMTTSMNPALVGKHQQKIMAADKGACIEVAKSVLGSTQMPNVRNPTINAEARVYSVKYQFSNAIETVSGELEIKN